MKAMVMVNYGKPGELKVAHVPVPVISNDDILVSVKAAGVNHIDSLKASGLIRHVYPLQFPWIPGADFAGVIAATGKNITTFRAGDEVYGSNSEGGAYAEFINVLPETIAMKPKSLTFESAAAVPMAAETAYQGLFNYGKLQPGQTVLIHGGAGAVGSCAIQLAHQSGIKVIATAAAAHRDHLATLGADEVIDYQTEDFESLVRDVDMVFDLVGGQVQERSFPIIKPGGHLIATNQLPSGAQAEKYQVTAVFMHARPSSETLSRFSSLVDAGKLTVGIAHVYPLEHAVQAWENISRNYISTADKRRGKHVLVTPGNLS